MRFPSDLPPTRFAGWPALPARLLLCALALLVAAGLGSNVRSGQDGVAITQQTEELPVNDGTLYRAIADRVASGEGYYAAAAAEQRTRGYPLRPFVTVRLPTLAYLRAALGPVGLRLVLFALLAAAWFTFRRRCAETLAGATLTAASVLAVAGLAPILNATLTDWHESYAGALLLLSLALRTRDRWGMSLVAAVIAAAFRELALPYLAVMAVVALAEGHRREAGAWAVAILAGAAMVGAHALAVAGVVTEGDAASPGWAVAGGWAFVLDVGRACTMLVLMPAPVVALAVPLALIGWGAWTSELATRATLTLGGYVLAFTAIGRPDNVYWGMLVGPMLMPGLALVPAALCDLVGAAGPHRLAARAA